MTKKPERKIHFGMNTRVRRIHVGRQGQRAKAVTSSNVTELEPPKMLGKGEADKAISGAGLDPKAFGEVLSGWVETGLVQKDGAKFLIPEGFLQSYIDKQLADTEKKGKTDGKS